MRKGLMVIRTIKIEVYEKGKKPWKTQNYAQHINPCRPALFDILRRYFHLS